MDIMAAIQTEGVFRYEEDSQEESCGSLDTDPDLYSSDSEYFECEEESWESKLDLLGPNFDDPLFIEALGQALCSIKDAWTEASKNRPILDEITYFAKLVVYQYPLAEGADIQGSQCDYVGKSIFNYYITNGEDPYKLEKYSIKEFEKHDGDKYTVIKSNRFHFDENLLHLKKESWNNELEKLPRKFKDKYFREALYRALIIIQGSWKKEKQERSIITSSALLDNLVVYQYPLSEEANIQGSQCESLFLIMCDAYKLMQRDESELDKYRFEEVQKLDNSKYTLII